MNEQNKLRRQSNLKDIKEDFWKHDRIIALLLCLKWDPWQSWNHKDESNID